MMLSLQSTWIEKVPSASCAYVPHLEFETTIELVMDPNYYWYFIISIPHYNQSNEKKTACPGKIKTVSNGSLYLSWR